MHGPGAIASKTALRVNLSSMHSTQRGATALTAQRHPLLKR